MASQVLTNPSDRTGKYGTPSRGFSGLSGSSDPSKGRNRGKLSGLSGLSGFSFKEPHARRAHDMPAHAVFFEWSRADQKFRPRRPLVRRQAHGHRMIQAPITLASSVRLVGYAIERT